MEWLRRTALLLTGRHTLLVLMTPLLLAACGVGGCRIELDPIAVERSGPLLADPAGGPPVECRGLDREQCEVGFGIDADIEARFAERDVDRVVVSCIGACRPEGGEFRIDVLFALGDSENLGLGGYGKFDQSCA
jgi:hypothetical protein